MLSMGISAYLKSLRQQVGHQLLMVPAVAAAIIKNDQAILLQRRSDNGLWGLPGGAIDPNEHPAQAVVREVFEETGLVLAPKGIAGVYGGPEFSTTYPNKDQVEMLVTLFVFEYQGDSDGSTFCPQDDESLELRFFPVTDLPHSPIITRYALPLVLSDTTKHHYKSCYFKWDDAWLDSLQDTDSHSENTKSN